MANNDVYIKLATMNNKADSKAMLRILELAMTPEEAEFLLALPAPTEDLAAKFNMDADAIQAKIKGLAQRGLVTASRKGHRYPRDPGTLHDNILASAPDKIPAGMHKAWMDLYEGEEWWREIASALQSVGSQILRVVPVVKSVPAETKMLPVEDLENIINAHADLISVRRCCCRVGAAACDHPVEVCTQFGSRAEYDLFRSGGRKISADEAISISIEAGKAGLVPTVTNMSKMEALEFICYCDYCGCMVLNPSIRAGNVHQILASSRFLVKVDNEKCNGCTDCVPVCFFGAVEMKKIEGYSDPKAVIYPEKCVGCGTCVLRCEPDAMIMEITRPPDSIPETISGPSSIIH